MSANTTQYVFTDANGNRYPIPRDGSLTMGAQGSDILLIAPGVESGHVKILKAGTRVLVKPDKGAVSINDVPITLQTTLIDGDKVTIGSISMHFSAAAHVAVSPTTLPAASGVKAQNTPSPAATSGFGGFGSVAPMPNPISTPAQSPSIAAPPNNIMPSTSTPPPNANAIVPASPTSVQPVSLPPQPLSYDERKQFMNDYFKDGQLFRKDAQGNNRLTYGQRFQRSTSTLHSGIILAEAGFDWLKKKQDEAKRAKHLANTAYITGDLIDDLIEEMVTEQIEVAMDDLGIMDHQLIHEPLTIYGPIFWREPLLMIDHIRYRKGEDGYIRYSAQKISIMLLTEKRIGVYTGYLDMIECAVNSSVASDYFYEDIRSITSRDITLTLEFDEQKAVVVHQFRLNVPGDDVEIILNSPVIQQQAGAGIREFPKHRRTINAIRQMWQTKKGN